MTRILHIVPTLGYGGVAKFVLNYYEHMDRNQVVFDFITHGGVEDFHQDLLSSRSNIFYFKTIGKIGLKNYFYQLKEIIGNNSYDAIHIHEGHITGVVAFMCRKLGVKKVICHAHTAKCPNKKHKPFMPIFRFLARRYGDQLLACGKEAGKYCFGKANFTIMHNALDIQKFCSVDPERVNRLKMNYSINEDSLVIGHIGAFITQKNHRYILEIYKKILEKQSNSVLVLVGNGILKEEIQDKAVELGISENIKFMGIQQDIPTILNMFDVFILPSLFEGLPVVGIEAQAVGVPCFFSNTIDKTVDLGLGIVRFLPIIHENITDWATSILENERFRPSQEEISNSFRNNGYDARIEINKLLEIYTK